MQRRADSAQRQVCLACRQARPGYFKRAKTFRECGTAAKYFAGCRCDGCRIAANAYNRAQAAKRRAAGKGRRTVAAVCAACGKGFQARADLVKIGKGKFCSHDCHNASQTTGVTLPPEVRERHRREGRMGSVRWRALRRAKNAMNLSGGKLVYVQGACIVCGTEYVSPGSQSRYCSRTCRDKNRSNRSYGLSWLDRMALFARDGWKCQICSEPVDYTADPLSDWYPSLDHVIPRSRGGSDEVSNLRTAHRWCNSVRGDMSYYTDADLAVQ